MVFQKISCRGVTADELCLSGDPLATGGIDVILNLADLYVRTTREQARPEGAARI